MIPSVINFLKRHAGSKFGDKKLVVITGTSSGLGKATTKALLRTNKYHVIGAVRDLEKMNVIADVEGFDMENFTPMHLDLASFDSVNNFVEKLDHLRGDRPIDRLACNAAVYQPTLDYPKWTEDGHEQQLQRGGQQQQRNGQQLQMGGQQQQSKRQQSSKNHSVRLRDGFIKRTALSKTKTHQ